ncbi:hypothetical protein LTSEMIN_1094 [Salmonella enterica subsp. enterica serovar Minnesota str. A4-603]|nr:hypothetical protein LTSEMIN_1094 [Salmonella enterica subsp. enterica serovar Minnesota str. A4-603]
MVFAIFANGLCHFYTFFTLRPPIFAKSLQPKNYLSQE